MRPPNNRTAFNIIVYQFIYDIYTLYRYIVSITLSGTLDDDACMNMLNDIPIVFLFFRSNLIFTTTNQKRKHYIINTTLDDFRVGEFKVYMFVELYLYVESLHIGVTIWFGLSCSYCCFVWYAVTFRLDVLKFCKRPKIFQFQHQKVSMKEPRNWNIKYLAGTATELQLMVKISISNLKVTIRNQVKGSQCYLRVCTWMEFVCCET